MAYRWCFMLLFAGYFLQQSHSTEISTICFSNDLNETQELYECDKIVNFSQFCHEITSDRTCLLFGDIYDLSVSCEVRDVKNLTIKAYNDSRVVISCSPDVDSGLRFLNVSSLKMSDIEFESCGAAWNATEKQLNVLSPLILSSLLFVSGLDLTLVNVNVSDAKSAGIYIYNVAGNVSVESCRVRNASSAAVDTLSGNVIAYDYHALHDALVAVSYSEFTNSGYSGNKNCSVNHSSGLVILAQSPHLIISLNHITFSGNTGCYGGNMALLIYQVDHQHNGSIITISNTNFTNGSSVVGGGLFIIFINPRIKKPENNSLNSVAKVLSIRNCWFTGNFAERDGGGLEIHWKLSLTNRPLRMEGILDIDVSNSTFINNTLSNKGRGGLALHYVTYIDTGNEPHVHQKFRVNLNLTSCQFYNHTLDSASAEEDLTESSVILAKNAPYLGINGISVASNNCTGILAIGSTMVFFGSSVVSENNALIGGGIRLCSSSVMYFNPHTSLTVVNNKAMKTGGGILVNTNCLTYVPMCFYQFTEEIINNSSLLDTVSVNVSNNHAPLGGNNIFGGSIDYCYLLYIRRTDKVYLRQLKVPNNTADNPSSISSNPQHVCFQIHNYQHKCVKKTDFSLYPGQNVTLPIHVAGQLKGTVPGTVSARAMHGLAIDDAEKIKTVNITGEDITYTLYSVQDTIHGGNAQLNLTADLNSDSSFNEYVRRFVPAVVHVKFKPCPFGFSNVNIHAVKDAFKCQCLDIPSIRKCSIENEPIITKKSYTWIGKYEVDGKGYLAYTNYCPLDYCNSTLHGIKSHSDHLDQDEQCQYNRTGILCGSCPNGSSLVLGSSECRDNCSNVWLLLIVPFALAGLLLVAVIHFLNLTVTMGTVCGLIFYANIVQDYSIPLLSSHPVPGLTLILRIFLSWLNLDLGIPTCFYHGMEAFGKTMLLSIFPVYIWLISIVIILLSRRYIFVTRLVGSNAVKVLATLFLLSYSKMLKVTIGSLNLKSMNINLGNGTTVTKVRWILDGNIPYFDPTRHLGVVVVAVVFITLSFPFSMTLLCIRYVYTLSNYCKVFSQIDRLKPFFDTYTGPFKDKARFWTGLLLLVRLLFLLMHALDVMVTTNRLIIISVCFILSAIMVALRGVYKSHSLNVLEYFYILNLAFIFTFNYNGSKGFWRAAINHFLVGLAFLSFIGILAYHAYLKCSGSKLVRKFASKLSRRRILFDVGDYGSFRNYERIESSMEDESLKEACSSMKQISSTHVYCDSLLSSGDD